MYSVLNESAGSLAHDTTEDPCHRAVPSCPRLQTPQGRNLSRHVGLFLILLLAFFSGSILNPVSLSASWFSSFSHLQTQESPQQFIPSLSLKTKEFYFDWAFADDPNENVTKAWVSLLPMGRGVIRLPTPHEFNGRVYNIGAYHTLHCLYTLRESFFAFYRMSADSSDFNPSEAAGMLKHGRHCIEYLRQVLICNPDLNLEPVEGSTGHLKTWGFKRECKDFEELSDWARHKRASNNQSIV